MARETTKALDVQESYFHAVDDEAAWLLIVVHRLTSEARSRVLQSVRDAADE